MKPLTQDQLDTILLIIKSIKCYNDDWYEIWYEIKAELEDKIKKLK